MPIVPIESGDDERLSPFRNVKDRTLAKQGGLFVAEGREVVMRLLTSSVEAVSVLAPPRLADEVAAVAGPDVPVYVAPKATISDILGYKFHRGLIACGRRPAPPPLEAMAPDNDAPATLLVCPQVLAHENLGALLRIAAAFGVAGVLLGERSSDPWWRRSIRVSMGAIFSLPVRRSDDLAADVTWLREQRGVRFDAMVVDASATPLARLRRPAPPAPDRVACVIGPEDHGLPDAWVTRCDTQATIPMAPGVDSLNIATAAAVGLYQITQSRSES